MFFSYQIIRKAFSYKKTNGFTLGERKIYSNKSLVPSYLHGKEVYVYNGKVWTKKFFNSYSSGFKFGEFKWSRKIAIYKAKQKKKK